MPAWKNLKARLNGGETLLGCFLALGDPLAAEIMGNAGYDWALIDLEHGAGDERLALVQMQALAGTGAGSVVRVEGTARQRANRVLDLGAEGIMFPRVDTAEDAACAAAAISYPPGGVRGVAFSNRAAVFGSGFREYMAASAGLLLSIVQVESPLAVDNAGVIAATPGVDVLFVGPSDLSHSLGILGQFDDPAYTGAIDRIAAAARSQGKHLGVLLPNPDHFDFYYSRGFRFIASGNDGVLLNNAARGLVARLRGSQSEAQKRA